MSSFLTHHGVLVALVCASLAIVYGVLTARGLLALSPGNERMQAISAAVQEGASAYLNRQYRTVGVVAAAATTTSGPPVEAITATRRLTRSAASAGSRS